MRANDVVGPWRLVRPLGTGGMGSVWEAVPTAGGAAVALKLLLEPGTATQRFIDEARRGQALDHPNVVRVFDFGHAGEHVWLSMELLDGRTLSSLLAGTHEPWPLPLVASLGAQALAGLTAVHQAFVHRDIKPSNLVLTRQGVLKLIDFGIALGADVDRTQTRTGTLRGSLPYTAPEHANGEAVDARCDLFSFGLVLHELLTGRRVFNQSSDAAIITALLLHPIPAPASVRPSLPPELDAVVMKALERDRTRRFASARDMAQALEACPLSEPVFTAAQCAAWLALQPEPAPKVSRQTESLEAAPPLPPAVVAPPPARPPRLLAAGLFAIALALLVVSYLALRPQEPEPAPAAVALTPPEPTPTPTPTPPPAVVEPAPAPAPAPEPEPPPARPAPRAQVRPKAAQGFLTVDARPTWGRVVIDGKAAGVTPLARLQLTEGRHVVEVTRDDGTSRKKAVRVAAGQEARWVVTW